MPTGYTAKLESMGYDVRRWLKESAARAMGMCILMREDGDLSEVEIKKRLSKEAGDYHSVKYRGALDGLALVENRTDVEWTSLFRKEFTKAQKDYAERLREHNSKKEKHIQAINETRGLWQKARDTAQPEGTVNTLRFAMDQLNSALEFDYGSDPYQEDVLKQDVGQFKAATIKKLEWDRDYHKRQGENMAKLDISRYESYCQLTDFVDKSK